MKKVFNGEMSKIKLIAYGFKRFIRYQLCSLKVIVSPIKTESNLQNELNKKFMFFIEEKDIGKNAYRRFMNPEKKINQLDSRSFVKALAATSTIGSAMLLASDMSVSVPVSKLIIFIPHFLIDLQ